jgi:hypothetical protein
MKFQKPVCSFLEIARDLDTAQACISACMDQLNGTGAYRSLQEPTSVKSRLRCRCHRPRLLLRRRTAAAAAEVSAAVLAARSARLHAARLGCTRLGSAARGSTVRGSTARGSVACGSAVAGGLSARGSSARASVTSVTMPSAGSVLPRLQGTRCGRSIESHGRLETKHWPARGAQAITRVSIRRGVAYAAMHAGHASSRRAAAAALGTL